ncbi:unnamed protein product [Bursaphelenchus okinawaensis]|uniref:RRM domain-containing protein n=1 Tax=Bursaphelenchus okinawaensis TaxID=465554 RepID=A0A811LQK2_9BILA|nr:unnamed protein product [Bursaphelenchus okinawaensis]CAG9127180.1 unnamed protein product [Bursaphelenchus okinawaensis]
MFYDEFENDSMSNLDVTHSSVYSTGRDSFMAGDNAILEYETHKDVPNDISNERYSTKIFVGGIPLGTTDAYLRQCFGAYDLCEVNWPGKKKFGDSPANGYCFIQFRHSEAVRALLNSCAYRDGRYCYALGRRRDMVQIRPWRLNDSTFTISTLWSRFVRLSVFVGGLPRILKASELYELVQRKFGNVLHCSMELEFETSYPKGAARVIFGDISSYQAAASAGHIEHQWYPNRHYNVSFVEFKPFVYKNIECERCGNSSLKTEFCTGRECLLYYCRVCYEDVHNNTPLFYTHQRCNAVPRDLPNPCRADRKAKEEKDRADKLIAQTNEYVQKQDLSTSFNLMSTFDDEHTENMALDSSTTSSAKETNITKESVDENIQKRPRKFGNLLQSYGVQP